MGMISVIQIVFSDGSNVPVRTDKDGYREKINALIEEKRKDCLSDNCLIQPTITQTTIEEELYLGIEKKRSKE